MSSAVHAPMAEVKSPDPSYVVRPIPTEQIDVAWPVLAPMLDRIPGMGERFGLEDVKEWLLTDELQAWGVFDTGSRRIRALFCTEVIVWPRCRILRVPFVAGHDLDRWIGLLPQFEAWARSQGFTEIEVAGRPGWSRVLGYKERARTLTKDLSRE